MFDTDYDTPTTPATTATTADLVAFEQRVEDKFFALANALDFLMTTVQISTPSPIVNAPPTVRSLRDVYIDKLEAARHTAQANSDPSADAKHQPSLVSLS